MTTPRRIAVFCMPLHGHMQRTVPVIAALTAAGCRVHVFTGGAFAPTVRQAGGHFEDLFAEHTPEHFDPTSVPFSSRYVTFAAFHGRTIAQRVAALGADLIVYDTFAVIARVVAALVRLPAVNLCAGHAVTPSGIPALVASLPRIEISAQCLTAVRILQEEFGIASASPFSYADGVSTALNVYAEPPPFLTDSARVALGPVAFFGSLPTRPGLPRRPKHLSSARQRVLVSFGSVVWRYFPDDAERLLRVMSTAFRTARVDAVISSSGCSLTPATTTALHADGTRVVSWADQFTELQRSDIFITHHGLNSTHEAIWHRVPMLSCPFVWDQPQLAVKCQSLGLALPLTRSSTFELRSTDVIAMIAQLRDASSALAERLDTAYAWELQTIAARPAVVRRMMELT